MITIEQARGLTPNTDEFEAAVEAAADAAEAGEPGAAKLLETLLAANDRFIAGRLY